MTGGHAWLPAKAPFILPETPEIPGNAPVTVQSLRQVRPHPGIIRSNSKEAKL